jgi:uncharacterized membrane protein
LEHILSSLNYLLSFDHAHCDAILQTRHLDVPNAYSPDKSPGWRDSVYVGFWVAVGWTTAVVAAAIMAWWNPKNSRPAQRFGLPIFAVFGVVCLYAQLRGMAAYVDTCRSLLNLH